MKRARKGNWKIPNVKGAMRGNGENPYRGKSEEGQWGESITWTERGGRSEKMHNVKSARRGNGDNL